MEPPRPKSQQMPSWLRHVAIALGVSLLACSSLPECKDAPRTPGQRMTPPRENTPADNLDDRASWLRERLIEDNHDLFARDPDETASKMRKMASSPYAYYRGTASIFFRDTSAAGAHHDPTRSGTAPHLLLVGDPHPENIGSFRDASDHMVIDFNDFDGAMYGPYHFDVRRLALGFYILGELASEHLSRSKREEMIRALLKAYIARITGAKGALGDEAFRFEREKGERAAGAILGDLIRRAERDGEDGEALDEYAPLNESNRREMFIGVLEPPEVEGVIRDQLDAVSEEERERVTRWMARYPASLHEDSPHRGVEGAFTIKGISRRRGAGVSSYPVRRYYVLVEGESERVEDDLLLELKESIDPPQVSPSLTFGARERASSGERVVWAQRILQQGELLDPLLGWSALEDHGGASVRVRHRTKFQKGVDVARIIEDLDEGELGARDVIELAERAGALLAASHLRSEAPGGASPGDAIAAAIRGDEGDFIEETTRFVERYGPATMEDHARLVALIARHGESLGHTVTNSDR